PLSFSAVEKLDVSCFGGADGYISVNGAGGSGTVEYSIDGTNFSANSIFNGLAADTYTLTVRDVGNGCTYSEQHTLNEPSELGLTISSTNITCNGDDDGSISGTASGGTAPYRISFDGGTSFVGSQFTTDFTITNLTDGIYEVSVVDLNGCTFTVPSNVEIVEPSAITASPTVADVACFGESTGSFTANASGGTAPLYYTIEGLSSNYLTSPTFENLDAGSYTLTVIDSKLCYEEYQLVIGEPTELTLAVTNATDPTCDGQSDGSITVAASGGTPSYFYSLDGENFDPSGTISNLSAGTYTILVEDENGCRAEVTEVIENQINLSLNTLATTHVSCNGEADGAFEVSLSGGTAVRYWIPNVAPQTSGVFTGLQAGSYEVTGQDTEGCTTTMTVEIQEPDELTVSVTQSGAGFTLTASGGTSPYEYSLDGTTFQASPTFEDLEGGLYTFTVLDANGCTVESADFNLVLSSIQNQLSIYPNPVRDMLKVEGVAFDRLTIYDLAGNRMISTKDHEVSFAGLKSGLYLVTLQDNLGQEIITKKILKN
ncbi:MAG: T9SS type A sorting domain-containing protein, partial [Cyclobacteriaceae bacterium]